MRLQGRDLLVVLGPTATGKTRLGVELARYLSGEILSADSRQVYRGLDIGTGKDLAEYGEGPSRVPVHLLDLVEPAVRYSLFHFQRDFFKAFQEITARGRLPILVGGSGLYLEAVLERYALVEAGPDPLLRARELSGEALEARLRSVRPVLHNTTDLLSREHMIRAIEIAEAAQRSPPPRLPELHPLVLGIRPPRPVLYARIGDRLRARLASGLIQEVERLLASGLPRERLDELGLEYRFVAAYLSGEIPDRASLEEQLGRAIRRFARRQLTWFARMERRGTEIHWLNGPDLAEAKVLLERAGSLSPDVQK